MLPLIGRIADLRGRVPVLVDVALVVFAIGSLVTALAYDLPSMVTGRFLQGVGGGGLVPATLALVADLYPVERRGVPLGVVSAVQELGSVLGPLFGAVVLAVADWRAIFGSTSPSAWSSPSRSAASGQPPAATTGSHRASRRPATAAAVLALVAGVLAGVLVTIPAAHPDARPHLGPAVHPGRRRRPLADPLGVVAIGGAVAVRGPLLPPPRARWSTCAAGARRSARPT
jgi:MFS family permease